MPNLTQSSCSTDADCNGEGKCVQVDNSTTTYCDCTIGYIEPHCKNRDPCMLEGNAACQNGSTCKRKSNFDYECMCRVPYHGEFCETYDLCNVDVDECIDDLNRDDPMDPICHPCAARATCIQISKRHYVCSCAEGYNHSSCYAYQPLHSHKRVQFLKEDEIISRDTWSPIIPTIAITSCCLYFILLLIALILLRKRKKFRPRLIVCCDIREFDDLSYYLISVETGKQWSAGTKGNVFCFLCGEHGQAGPYPLFDRNLAEVQTLQRCQEDNYLVSHTMDIGQVDKIVLWVDDKPASSTWHVLKLKLGFCDKITVRNVKTEKNWFFYISTWFNSKEKKKRHEFLVATTEYVRKRSEEDVGINCRHYSYQMQRHHSYISPFIYPSPERITLMFTEWMSCMLILISLYGFLSIADPDINYVGNYVFRVIVPENGSLTAFACWWIVLTCALLLVLFVRIKRIPTLIIWHNKPGMPEEPIKKRRPKRPPVPKSKDEATETDLLSPTITTLAEKESGGVYPDEVESRLFRIPSTDLVRTEEWVEVAVDKPPKDALTDEAFVHSYDPSIPRTAPEEILDYGLIGGLTDGRQQEPNRFVYVTKSSESNPVCAGIEKDIEDIYGDFPFEAESVDALQPYNSQIGLDDLPSRKITIDEIPMNEDDTDTKPLLPVKSTSTLQLVLGAGDFSRETIKDSHVKVYCELCEMEMDRFWNLIAKICLIIGWILCILIILAATIICCIYGGRYGYQRTYDWIISLIFSWLQSLLFYQFVKVLFVVIIVSILVKRKKLPSLEARKVSERFQVYYANGLAVFPEKYDLKFVQYLPNTWISTSHVKLDQSTVSSVTNITQRPGKNV